MLIQMKMWKSELKEKSMRQRTVVKLAKDIADSKNMEVGEGFSQAELVLCTQEDLFIVGEC